jgi:hypothetical protein
MIVGASDVLLSAPNGLAAAWAIGYELRGRDHALGSLADQWSSQVQMRVMASALPATQPTDRKRSVRCYETCCHGHGGCS